MSQAKEKVDFKWRQNLRYILVTIPMFMGYSALQNLQKYMKDRLNITDGVFAAAYPCLYITNMLFRFFHNYFWVFTKPFWRIVIGYALMTTAQVLCIVIQLVDWGQRENQHAYMAFITFIVAGMGFGTFGSNMLNVMSLISPGARYFAVMGIPIGINFITIFSFMIVESLGAYMGSNQVTSCIYGFIIFLLVIGLVVLYLYVPHGPFLTKRGVQRIDTIGRDDGDQDGPPSAARDAQQRGEDENELTTSVHYLPLAIRHYKEWIWPLLPYLFAWCAHQFTNTQFSPGIVLYTINEKRKVTLFGMQLETNYFKTVLACCCFVADITSRVLVEYLPDIFPVFFNMINITGALLVVSGITELTIVAGLIITFAGGSIYQQTTRWVRDVTQGTNWNLISYSVWLFCGDLGNVLASSTQQALKNGICEDMRSKLKGSGWDPCPYYDPPESG